MIRQELNVPTSWTLIPFDLAWFYLTDKCKFVVNDEDSGNSSLSIIEIPHLRAAAGCC